MSTLHLLRHPQGSKLFDLCLLSLSDNDSVILLSEAIHIDPSLFPCTVYALRDELSAFGRQHALLTIIDYDEFVGLTVAFDKSLSW